MWFSENLSITLIEYETGCRLIRSVMITWTWLNKVITGPPGIDKSDFLCYLSAHQSIKGNHIQWSFVQHKYIHNLIYMKE